jgi:hypothetical protein
MNAEQRLLSYLVLISWIVWGGLLMRSRNDAEQLGQGSAAQMVPAFLEFLSDYPVSSSDNRLSIPNKQWSKTTQGRRSSAAVQTKKTQPKRWYNLNRVDSAFLESLPRIGPGLAGRICRYRSLLGGYYSVEQLDEVWGIYPDQLDAISPWFHVGDGAVQQLCADTSSWDDLRRHPYIGFDGARMIERFREHHDLEALSDLLEAVPITDSLYRSWEPYLRICNAR